MIGNLKVFLGSEEHQPRTASGCATWASRLFPRTVVLWGLRIGLILAFFFHILAAYQLTRINRRARPVKYQSPRDYVAANFASRTMRWTGVIIALFLIFHLLDLTWGPANPDFVRGDVYNNLVHSFERVPVAIVYIVANIALGIHIFHGAWAMFQSLGLNNPRYNLWKRYFATGFAVRHHRRQREHAARSSCTGEPSATASVADERAVRCAAQERQGCSLDESPGPIEEKWEQHKFDVKLVNPANKRRYEIIVVGSGLAGASAAASLGELGYHVTLFTFHDSPRRAHSIAAQGGINAAKNYKNDGDSIHRLFYDTVKGGDFRSREANVYRLAQLSVNIIDQCVAQGVPFAREYGGLLDNRSFGGAQVSRTFYARGQTGQQLLLGAYQALMHQVALGSVTLERPHRDARPRREGRARGRHRHPRPDHRRGPVARRARGRPRHRRLRQRLLPLDQRQGEQRHRRVAGRTSAARSSRTPATRRSTRRASRASDDFQSKLTLMSESLRNDGRVWVPEQADDPRSPDQIPESERDYFLERRYPAFGNLVPRDVASRAAKREVDAGRGVGPLKNGVYLDFADSIKRLGHDVIEERYGNLFEMYERITDEDPYKVPMRIYPAIHYTMGGLWVDYDLMSNVPGLYVLGEANFSDHGANRLGRQRAHAGPRRRLLRAPGDDLRLPRAAARREAGARRRPRVPRGGGRR